MAETASFHPPATATPPSGRRWFLEGELACVVILVAAIFFTRMTTLSIRGEESRWAQAARHMIATGDWFVPRQQGQVFAERPPLVTWLIALCGLAAGDCVLWAVRLPSTMATLATTIVIYGYSRTFLGRLGAASAAAAFATTAIVLQFGRLTESEAVMACCTSASLLVWHAGYVTGWQRLGVWTAGYALAALAGLAKGPQGPVYFCGAVGLFLLARRDWRMLFCWQHIAGVGAFVLILAAWQIPFYLRTDGDAVVRVWVEQSAARIVNLPPGTLARHMLTYPLELAACLLPWLPLLGCLAYPSFWKQLGHARTHVVFISLAVGLAFLSVWLAAAARTRYFYPVVPLLAPLVGLVIERCLSEADRFWRWAWPGFTIAMGVLMIVSGVAVVAVSLGAFPVPDYVRESPVSALAFAVAAIVSVAALWWANRPEFRLRAWAPLVVASFLGLVHTWVVMNGAVRRSEDVEGAVARVRLQLPPGKKLVSFGRTHHQFAYHYGEPIPLCPWPADAPSPPVDADYFCFEQDEYRDGRIPFAWETVARVSCERNRTDTPQQVVVVGRRLSSDRLAADPKESGR